MIARRRSSTVAVAAISVAIAFVATACGSSSSGGSAAVNTSPTANANLPAICGGQQGSGNVLVADAGFAENEVLAAIFADALNACGYHATTKTFASREAYYPLVKKGKIQVVPEYAATLTDFINAQDNGAKAPSKASGDIGTTVKNLRAELPASLAVLDAAIATDKNTFAVKTSFATANHLTTVSDLAAYSQTHSVSLAGPPECPTRPFCEPGLKDTYGMKISGFKQTDVGGPLTIKALTSGKATMGLVFTSDPTVAANNLTVLADDKNLQASDNIIPLVAKSLEQGAAANALNAVIVKLDQTTLVDLNKAVQIDHGTPAQVAQQFVAQLNAA